MTNILLVRQGDYNPKYLELLTEQIKVNYGDEIVCLTDNKTGYLTERPLKDTELTGWWAKMELFAPWNKDLRPFWYLDLDSYVMSSIKEIKDYKSDQFHMCKEWLKAENVNWSQSSMLYVPDSIEADWIWQEFIKDKTKNMKTPGGDQVYMSKFPHKFIQDVFPDLIGSYKCHKQQEEPKTKIITFHGQPKPERTEGWAQEVWCGR